jgi:hypothetical protein
MARRRFEMHHYRQALLRMRQGDSDRDIAAARVMGRPKAAQWPRIATERGWLDTAQLLPDDEAISTALGQPRKAACISSSALMSSNSTLMMIKCPRQDPRCNTFLNITTTPPFMCDDKSPFNLRVSHHINPKSADGSFQRRRGRTALCPVIQQQGPRAAIAGRECSDRACVEFMLEKQFAMTRTHT